MIYRIPPWKHQLQAIEAARSKSFHLLRFEPGCGKTLTAINIVRELCHAAGDILDTLVICPNSVQENWRREFLANCYDEVATRLMILKGSGVQKSKQVLDKSKQIFIVNFEALDCNDLFQAILKRGFKVLIIDEIHKIKNPSAARSKKAIKIADSCRYRYGLTGTLILQSLEDLWSPLRALCGKSSEFVHQNFFSWRIQHFYNKNALKFLPYPEWVPRQGAKEKLDEILTQCSSFARKSECLDLPPLIKKTLYVDLTAEQERHYRELEKDFLTYLGSEACVATTAMTKLLRCQQVASGFLPLTTNDSLKLITSNKLDLLRDLLKELTPEHKVIVWTCWRASYEQVASICEELGLGFVRLVGDTKLKDRQEAIDRFSSDSNVRVFISNPSSGGIGLNLQAASVSIHYAKDYNLEHYLQAAARNYRAGSEIHPTVFEYHLVTLGTVEERIEAALKDKMNIGAFFDGMRSEICNLVKENL